MTMFGVGAEMLGERVRERRGHCGPCTHQSHGGEERDERGDVHVFEQSECSGASR
jgi:hypothetical protein